MNGYGIDNYGRNGFHPVNGADPYHRDDPLDYGRSHRNGYAHDLDRNSFDGRYDMRDNEVVFELDHLATYTSKSGVMQAEDGLRKLRQMESSTGIWTMRCTMVIERKYNQLVIIDKGNGEELERFALELVHEPTAIFKDDKREIYTNLILFTVLEDPRKRNAQADMHIFQSIVAPAQEIVDEIQAAKEGRSGTSSGQRIPPPPMGPAPNPPRFGGDDIEFTETQVKNLELEDEEAFHKDSAFGRTEYHRESSREYQSNRDFQQNNFVDDDFNYRRGGGGYGGLGQSNRASFIPTDMDGGQNEVLERDVQLLNACFDDIEKFVSRLQQAAEAYKELERRRKDRNSRKSKNSKQAGDGMLNMRAKPPPADDFIDIFEKFKFAFNLLAKLKAHIHDPNAPELVHFLFTPLSLIYEASRDPVHGGRDLADSAHRPAITNDAKQLLLNCLTSKELELWQSLGKSWTSSRESYGDNYMPRFYNGWAPAISSPPDRGRERMEDALINHERQIRDREIEERARREASDMVMPFPPRDEDRGYIGRSTRYDNYNRPPEDAYARSTKRPSTPPPGVPYTNPNVARYQEHVEQHINRNRDVHMPAPEPKSKQEKNLIFAQEVARSNGRVMEAVHDRTGRNQKEISVEKGDLLQVLDDSRNWWKLKNYEGTIGYAPYTILKEYTPSDLDGDKTRGTRSSGEYNSHIHTNGAPVPPPPPPPPSSGRRQDDGLNDRGRSDQDGYDRRRRRSSRKSRDDSDDDYTSDSDSDPKYRHGRRKKSSPRDESDDGSQYSSDRDRYDRRRNDRKEEKKDKRQKNSPTPKSNVPPPPPPGSRPPALRGHNKDKKRDDLHDELQQRMSIGRQSSPRTKPENKNIDTRSSAADVADWLEYKGFSHHCIKTLKSYNGEDIFRLKRKEMDRLLGPEEGHRLESQVLVQRNKAGYKTTRSGELQAILQKRKQKAETQERPGYMGAPPSFSPETPDYSDTDSDASDNLENVGKTLRAMLRHQRKRISNIQYHD